MKRKKIKLAFIENDPSRALSLRKRRLGLSKKVKELSILCDVRACIIMFNPNEALPMVWPSVPTARLLLDKFFAIPDFERRKQETNLQQYLQEKTKKIQEKLMRTQKESMAYLTDQLMVQLQHGRRIADFNMSEIHALLSYSKVKIMLFRKRLEFMQHPPLRDLPLPPFEAQSEDFRTIVNDIFSGGSQNDERAKKTDESGIRVKFDDLRDNESYYILDQWVFPSEQHKPRTLQQMATEFQSYKNNQNPISYFPYRGSCSNGNPNLEMESVGLQGITFNGLIGSVSQPLQHYNMNNNPIMAISQPRQYPFDITSRDLGVQEEGSNNNNGDLQFTNASVS
ncbi:Agamous-like MADS-box protein AGL80 [Cardamine amara subsp. amara]|uniref:Agamous-like MADS-box protein AGL80 n=1 Tax=Cardamine amara subsp. amara TaxID=228776 RepID=A0ABD1BLD0_CARAN